MLTKLSIENIALVERAELTFQPGLTVLTGETGAGKSIIVTALSLALGERGDKEFIRHGRDNAVIEATFDQSVSVKPDSALSGEHPDESVLIVKRELFEDGSSRAKANGKQLSLQQLKRLTAPLAEILGQHAGQMLMDEDNHLLFLDRFASLEPLREQLTLLFADWQKVSVELRSIKSKREQLMQERELLMFQKEEIEKGRLRVGEEEQLLGERKILDSARSLMASADTVVEILDGDENSVSQLLASARKELERMAGIDPALDGQREALAAAEFQIEDLRRAIQQYGASIRDDPQRIEEINLRLDEIYRLKKKYGGTEDAALSALADIIGRLKDRPDTDSLIDALEKQHDRLEKLYTDEAVALSEARTRAADRLRKQVVNELKQLAIDHCAFQCELLYEEAEDGILLGSRAVKPLAHGLERARFLFSANLGAPLKSLVRTASGGEISRVLLALKAATLSRDNLSRPLLVFDEVDAGIGGHTATEVGRKLKTLSQDCQVLVITHLHQIARLADHHFVAEKTTDRRRSTTISVRRLNRNEIAAELDRMVALPEEVSDE
ncbi:MAG TPA: DNA repair protein RecN [Candidatus Deferrimicrobium sp.]|nr:DNA repair protein RecN [Candidatus Deferrimicrobium sp.]